MDGIEIVSVGLSGIIAFLFWKIKQFEGKDFLTREQIKELIKEKTDPLHEDMTELKVTIAAINEQVVSIGVTLARIDERMKKNA